MERILYVLQYSYPKNFRSTNFKIINRKREENKTKEKKKKKSNIQLGTKKKKGNFQKEKKEKDEIAGRIVKMQCRRKDETLQSRFCQSRTTSSNVKT